jgi:hypothetical protein
MERDFRQPRSTKAAQQLPARWAFIGPLTNP